MKKLILDIINLTLYNYYKFKLIIQIAFIRENQTIVFIDIDNTIADTWPSIKSKKYSNEIDRHKNLTVFDGMKDYIQSNFRGGQHQVIYLTARHFNLIYVTKSWLVNNGFFYAKDCLILISKPTLKPSFIKLAIKKNLKVIYIDDLSYNHENGHVRFYENVIKEIEVLNVSYIGYKEINKINNDIQID
jgi:hypothetical protein